MPTARKILETDLYLPVKEYLTGNGYLVRSEVAHCDITATKGDDLIVVELKTSANLTLLMQATDRQRITSSVYVAIPEPKKRRASWRGLKRVLRQLELGLIVVTFSPRKTYVSVVFDPLPYQRTQRSTRRNAVIREIAARSEDYNTGGTTRQPLMTAYRENALFIAACLEQLGPSSPRELRALGTGEKTLNILSANHYSWFQRTARARYEVTDLGCKQTQTYPAIKARAITAVKKSVQDTTPAPRRRRKTAEPAT